MTKIAILTTSFAKADRKPLELIEGQGFSVVTNPTGRVLTKNEILPMIDGCVGVIAGTEAYDRATLKQLKALKVISRCGVGVDTIDLSFCQESGIKVYTTPDCLTRSVAELVIGLTLNLLRHISLMDRHMRAGLWQKEMGNLLYEKRFGVIGLGRIGREVARLAGLLGAKVLFYDSLVQDGGALWARLEIDELLKQSDIVSLHIPFTSENVNFMDARKIGLMKRGAYLVNCSRGGIVNEEALFNALKNKNLGGAAMDVFEKEPYTGPLLELENVIATPHIGSYAQEARVKMEIEAAENLIKGLKEK